MKLRTIAAGPWAGRRIRAAVRRRDAPVCLPGRAQIARSLFAERKLHARHAGQRLRGADQARQGPEDHSRPRRALGDGRADALALPPAQGRQIPQRRGLHRRRRRVLRRAHVRSELRHQDPHPAGRHQGREGRRPHGRFHPAEPEPHSALRMGHLVHHVEEVGRGEQHRRGAARLRPVDELRGAQHQRHRPVHHHRASGRREDRVQEEPELVGQGRAQHRRGDLHHDRQRRDARRRAALRRRRLDRSGAAAGRAAHQCERRRRSACRARSCAPSSSASTRCGRS